MTLLVCDRCGVNARAATINHFYIAVRDTMGPPVSKLDRDYCDACWNHILRILKESIDDALVG